MKLQGRPSAYAEHVSRGGTPVRSPAKTDEMKNEPKRTLWEVSMGDAPNATTCTSTPTPITIIEDVCDDTPTGYRPKGQVVEIKELFERPRRVWPSYESGRWLAPGGGKPHSAM